ncbi:hypothetical protein [Desulfovibrio aminophilus]|uniref:hypothetical protein n=1 Tax=Desulfovibrio aminophilus TaxID=81425 RepID=UPI0003FE38DC|nr:hypothetical protein [Desulfovibrio aminophilus]
MSVITAVNGRQTRIVDMPVRAMTVAELIEHLGRFPEWMPVRITLERDDFSETEPLTRENLVIGNAEMTDGPFVAIRPYTLENEDAPNLSGRCTHAYRCMHFEEE